MHAENIDVKIKFYFVKLTSMCFIKNIHLREEVGSCQHTKVLCFFFFNTSYVTEHLSETESEYVI